MSDERVRLQIPESDSYSDLREINVKLLFDDPFALHEKQETDYEVWFYTVEDLADGVEKSITAYKGLHGHIQKTGGVTGSTLSLGKVGSGKSTQYFIKHTGGPKRDARVATQPTTANAVPSKSATASNQYEPYTEEEMKTILQLCGHHLDVYEEFLAAVTMRPGFRGLTEDQMARLATGAMIATMRTYRRGMTVAVPKTEQLFDDEPPF